MEVLIKHLNGWMTSTVMDVAWLERWKERVKKNEDQDLETVVFRIPRKKSGIAIKEIELLLQKKFPLK